MLYKVLVPAGEVTDPVIALMPIDALFEFVAADELEKLSENGLLGHGAPREGKNAGNSTP